METCTAEFQRLANQVELPVGIETDRFALICVVAYFVVTAIVWIQALPSYLAARDGLTPEGNPIGWLPYSLGTAVLSIAIVSAAYRGRASARNKGRTMAGIERKVAPA